MMSTGEIPSLSHVTYKNIFYWKKVVRKSIQSRKSTSAFWQNLHTIQQRTWMQRFWLILNVAISLIPSERKRTMLLKRRANKCKQVVSYHICSLNIILKWILKINRFQLHSQNETFIIKLVTTSSYQILSQGWYLQWIAEISAENIESIMLVEHNLNDNQFLSYPWVILKKYQCQIGVSRRV